MNDRNTTIETVLAVGAHPDDLEYQCGGTISAWASEGKDLYMQILTTGGKGADQPVDPDRQTRIRQNEQQNAVDVLGVNDVIFSSFPDGFLSNSREVVRQITREIRRREPDRVLAWDGWARYQPHPDHRAAGRATMNAVVAAANPNYFPDQLNEDPVSSAHETEDVFLYGTDQPNVHIDITDTITQKIMALMEHESQVSDGSDVKDELLQCARNNAKKTEHELAESFRRLRPLCET